MDDVVTFDFASFIFGALVGAVSIIVLVAVAFSLVRWLYERSDME